MYQVRKPWSFGGGDDEMWKKVMYSIVAVCFLVTLIFGGVQTCRLERSMAELGQCREQLELAENRESEIRATVNRTGLILSETTTSVAELREKLKEIQDCYNSLWNMFYDNDDTIYNREDKIDVQ